MVVSWLACRYHVTLKPKNKILRRIKTKHTYKNFIKNTRVYIHTNGAFKVTILKTKLKLLISQLKLGASKR